MWDDDSKDGGGKLDADDSLGQVVVDMGPAGTTVDRATIKCPGDMSRYAFRLSFTCQEMSAEKVAGIRAAATAAAAAALAEQQRAHLEAEAEAAAKAMADLEAERLLEHLLVDAVKAVQHAMTRFGIDAPLMMTKGDGSLARAETIAFRPIETVLSGPAASLVGAATLSGLSDFILSDMGGTTTDLGVLENGRPPTRMAYTI